ncbi:MAG: biotin/lipoyl-binding protein [Enhydrobacter sp.]|nr:MAG: biotin/lipoyl-binding protein [Enhydrobacter sp.]
MNSRVRRAAIVGGTIAGLFLLYEVTDFVAYTDGAYVRSDLVAVAPEVTGTVAKVHVVDNQRVKVGDLLVTIDPEPHRLAVAQRAALSAQESALLRNAQEELDGATAPRDTGKER